MNDETSAAGSGNGFRVRELRRDEALAVLAGGWLGRLAFATSARVDIRPVAYALDPEGDWIFGRMESGGKVEALLHHRWAAFQVDEIEGPWSWRSVVVHGAVHFLNPEEAGEGGKVAARAVETLRNAIPSFGGPDDPGAFRAHLFGMTIQEIAGRAGRIGV